MDDQNEEYIIDDTRHEDIFGGDPDEELTQEDIDKLIDDFEE